MRPKRESHPTPCEGGNSALNCVRGAVLCSLLAETPRKQPLLHENLCQRESISEILSFSNSDTLAAPFPGGKHYLLPVKEPYAGAPFIRKPPPFANDPSLRRTGEANLAVRFNAGEELEESPRAFVGRGAILPDPGPRRTPGNPAGRPALPRPFPGDGPKSQRWWYLTQAPSHKYSFRSIRPASGPVPQ